MTLFSFIAFILFHSFVGLHLHLVDREYEPVVRIADGLDICVVGTHQILLAADYVEEPVAFEAEFLDSLGLHSLQKGVDDIRFGLADISDKPVLFL